MTTKIELVDSWLNYEVLAWKVIRFPRALKNTADVLKNLISDDTPGEWVGWLNENDDEIYDGFIKEVFFKDMPAEVMAHYYDVYNESCRVFSEIFGVGMYTLPVPEDDLPMKVYVKKYLTGCQSSTHVDNFIEDDTHAYTVGIYWNDDYEGGELGFPDYGIHLKPEAGDFYIFPCSHLHYGDVVTSGTKYISTDIEVYGI